MFHEFRHPGHEFKRPVEAERGEIRSAKNGFEPCFQLDSESRQTGGRNIDRSVAGDGHLSPHEIRQSRSGRRNAEIPRGEIDVEEIATGRFPPGKRGAVLFGETLFERQASEGDRPDDPGSGNGIEKQRLGGQCLCRGQEWFAQSDFKPDDLRTSRKKRGIFDRRRVFRRVVVPRERMLDPENGILHGQPVEKGNEKTRPQASFASSRTAWGRNQEIEIFAEAVEIRVDFGETRAALENEIVGSLRKTRKSDRTEIVFLREP